jgi:DNA mismatch repair protein MutS
MAQCGSFVPADSASLGILDRIFTRIGSADNLAEGKSTFLVEMEETATICTQATQKSLVILDEVGRGTSTFDGMALAQAIIEHILQKVQARCLFATHYHELTKMQQDFSTLANYHMECYNSKAGVMFLHKISKGIAGSSFGLEVAKLANVPMDIVTRAADILKILENSSALHPNFHLNHGEKTALNQNLNNSEVYKEQLSLKIKQLEMLELANKKHKQLIQTLEQIDSDTLSPKQAFDLIWQIKSKL